MGCPRPSNATPQHTNTHTAPREHCPSRRVADSAVEHSLYARVCNATPLMKGARGRCRAERRFRSGGRCVQARTARYEWALDMPATQKASCRHAPPKCVPSSVGDGSAVGTEKAGGGLVPAGDSGWEGLSRTPAKAERVGSGRRSGCDRTAQGCARCGYRVCCRQPIELISTCREGYSCIMQPARTRRAWLRGSPNVDLAEPLASSRHDRHPGLRC